MGGKVLFILIDGLSLVAAKQCMSFMQAMNAAGKLETREQQAFLPPLSRPAYATLLLGKAPLEHGILSNENYHTPLQDTFFHQAVKAGLRTGAAAYGWFYELCCGDRFELSLHRQHHNEQSSIQHGLFYCSDAYPDQETFADAEGLRKAFNPDLLLLHSMGVDWAGHQYGGHSSQYRDAVRNVDSLLAKYLPGWLEQGYAIFITADHGMNEEGSHYDVDAGCREIPCWRCGKWSGLGFPKSPIQIKANILAALGVKSEE